METYNTDYGLISLYKNEKYIGDTFKKGNYWDIETLLQLREYIPPNRNILEIGGHCGTSSIVYATFLDENKFIHVYEPQKNMYNILLHNIKQNNLEDKCSICLDDMKINQEVIELQCNHIYHSNCINEYLTNYNYKCPCCKEEIGRPVHNI